MQSSGCWKSCCLYSEKQRGERELWDQSLRPPSANYQTLPRTGLRTQQHCYVLLPADHKALGQAHINVLNYEAACDECFLVHFQREPYLVINHRITTPTNRRMQSFCSRSKCKADVKQRANTDTCNVTHLRTLGQHICHHFSQTGFKIVRQVLKNLINLKNERSFFSYLV